MSENPFELMLQKYDEMLCHVDVSPDYRKELREIAAKAKEYNTQISANKSNNPNNFNIETAGQILTIFKTENENLKEQLAVMQVEYADLREALIRMGGWLEARHLCGLMPQEQEIVDRPFNVAHLKNAIHKAVASSIECHVSTIQAQAQRITELENQL